MKLNIPTFHNRVRQKVHWKTKTKGRVAKLEKRFKIAMADTR